MTDASPAPVPCTVPPPLRAGAARRVLVVEDNDDVRRLIQRLLRLWGYDAPAAADGPAGVEAAVAHRPHAALVDLGLPGLDGYGVARQVRAALGDAIRLVALTGFNDPDDLARATDAGFDVHLVKPVQADRLEKTLRDLLGPND